MSSIFRIWAIGDPHLSFAKPKPMDIFGGHWKDHAEKIARNCRKLVAPEDLLLIPGDISWALKRADAIPDLQFVSDLPGTKVLIKGNHDYWWNSDRPLAFSGLHDTPFIFRGGDVGIAGTRGWDEVPQAATSAERTNHQKHVDKEVARLTRRIKSIAHCKHRIALIHYPPLPDFIPLLQEYQVETVLYGHVHIGGSERTLPEEWFGMRCLCVAADRIQFTPKLISTLEFL